MVECVLIEREPYWGKDKWWRRGGRDTHHIQYNPTILSTPTDLIPVDFYFQATADNLLSPTRGGDWARGWSSRVLNLKEM